MRAAVASCGAYRSSSDDFHGLLPALIAAAATPLVVVVVVVAGRKFQTRRIARR